jgi:hypothetical protein
LSHPQRRSRVQAEGRCLRSSVIVRSLPSIAKAVWRSLACDRTMVLPPHPVSAEERKAPRFRMPQRAAGAIASHG